MTALTDAALDHAAMSEGLLDQAARHQAEAEAAQLAIDALREQLGELADESPDFIDHIKARGVARDQRDTALAAAQVHATLACAPRLLPIESVATLETRTTDVRAGDRVVMINAHPERRGTRFWYALAGDAIGTVQTVSPEVDALAIVDWDDIGTEGEPIPAAQLKVVLGG